MWYVHSVFLQLGSLFVSRRANGFLVACVILFAIGLFLVPVSPGVLDVLLLINIVIALTLLLRGLFLVDPVTLYAFPTLLLFTTVFRLALNVSSTRLILLYGHQGTQAAGSVIGTFGDVVVRGNFVVGAIIFAIIALVNFLVIAKGSARVAEVAARFTLDALPGRQLAIDADMRAGNITCEDASARRSELAQESQFFGAMDGAMKFVQGDAIAGLIITFINAVGGVSIGVTGGLSFIDAINRFGVLTIGDGLVSILPSLLISICAGIVVTHVAAPSMRNTSEKMYDQLAAEPQVPVFVGVLLLALIFVGFPIASCLPIGGLLIVFGLWRASKGSFSSGHVTHGVASVSGFPAVERGTGFQVIEQDEALSASPELLTVEIDSGVIGDFLKSNSELFPEFVEFVTRKRRSIFVTRGITLPEVRFALNHELGANEYKILVREQAIRYGILNVEHSFVVASPAMLRTFGIKCEGVVYHPITGTLCCWISNDSPGKGALIHLGAEVMNVAEFLVLEAYGAAFEVVDELFGLNETMKIIDGMRSQNGVLIDGMLDSHIITLGELAEVLKRLLKERVNIRDVKLILEGISEFAAQTQSSENRTEWLRELHSFLRLVLSRSIIGEALTYDGTIRVFVLSDRLEEEFREAMAVWDGGRIQPPLSPFIDAGLRVAAHEMFQPVLDRGVVPIVVLCVAEIRVAVQEFFANRVLAADSFRAIAFEELCGKYRTEPVGVLHVSE